MPKKKTAKKRPDQLADQFRKAIDDSGQTRYRIAQGTGISESALAHFYNGHRGISPAMMAALCDYLELEVIVRPKRPKRKGK